MDFLKSQPEWRDGDEMKRREWLRDVAIKSRAEADPEHHAAVIGNLWGEVDGRGLVEQAADFTKRGVKEVLYSYPALGGAAVLAATDAVNLTDSGSGVRLARGVADMASGTVQRVKSLHPDDYQERRDTVLGALREDIDKRVYPKGLETWLMGDDGVLESDPETKEWVEALTKGFAKDAVRAQHGDGYTEDQVQRWMESDRNPAARRSMAEEFGPGPRELLADYVATGDPTSWDAFQRRVSETDTQINTRLQRHMAEGELRQVLEGQGKDTLMGEMTRRSAEMQGSPIDLALSIVPLLAGARALQAAKAGNRVEAALQAAKGVGIEAGSEALTEAVMDPNAPTSQVVEAGGLGAVGATVMTGTMATTGHLLRDRSGSENLQQASPGGVSINETTGTGSAGGVSTAPGAQAGAAAAVPQQPQGAPGSVPGASIPTVGVQQVAQPPPLPQAPMYVAGQTVNHEGQQRVVRSVLMPERGEDALVDFADDPESYYPAGILLPVEGATVAAQPAAPYTRGQTVEHDGRTKVVRSVMAPQLGEDALVDFEDAPDDFYRVGDVMGKPAVASAVDTGAQAAPMAVETPGAATAPQEATAAPSASRLRMAERVLTTQGVEPEVAKALAARIASGLDDGLGPEQVREAVLAKFRTMGGTLPGSVPKAYVESAVAYEAQGYPAEEAAVHAENSRIENQKLVDAAHEANRRLAVPDPLEVRIPSAAAAAAAPGPGEAQAEFEPGSGLAEGPGASGVDEWNAPQFGQRLKANEQLKGSWRNAFDPSQYKRRTEVEWGGQAAQWIDQNGIAGAAAMVFDPESGLEGSDRVVLAGVLLDRVDAQAAQAEQAGDIDQAAQMNSLAADLADSLSLNGSKAGQEVRAYGYLVRRSPGMVLRNFERERGEAIKADLETKLQTTEGALKQDVETTVAEETRKARADEAKRLKGKQKLTVDDRVSNLVDKYAKEMSDTLTGPDAMKRRKDALAEIVKEYLARPFDTFGSLLEAMGVSPRNATDLQAMLDEQRRRVEGIRQAKVEERRREMAQRTADGVLNSMASELSDTPPAHRQGVRNAVRELVKAYLDQPFPDFVERMAALGVKESTAQHLLPVLGEQLRREAAIDDAVRRQAEAERPNNEAQRIIDRMSQAFSDTPGYKAKVQNAVRELAAEYLAEPMVDFVSRARDLGVDPTKATHLQGLLDEQLKRVAAVAREKAGQALVKRLQDKVSATPKVKSKVPALVDNLLKAVQNGVLGRPEFLEAYARAFDMPEMTPEVRARIRSLAQAAQAAPEGALRAEAVNALNNELAIFSGVKARDAIITAWYANLLSGLATQGINIYGNATNLLLKTITAGMTNNPQATLQMLAGYAKGWPRAWAEAKNALKGGVVYKGAEKYGQLSALELIAQQGGPQTLGQWAAWLQSAGGMTRFVFRGLAAMDAVFFYTAKEGRAHLAAARAAIGKGLTPGTPEFQKAMQEDMGLGSARWMQALDQAAKELRDMGKAVDPAAQNRRAWDIIEQSRPLELRAETSRYGDLATYQQEPEGSGKLIYNLAMDIQNFTVGGVPVLRPFVPFARILSNIWSNNLDYTPIGIWRGLNRSHIGSSLTGDKSFYPEWERRERIAAGVLGTALGAAVYASALKYKDDDDVSVPFMLYGQGPPSKAARDQMPKGWRPFSIKVGDKYLSYAETPLVFILAPLGAVIDKERYSKSYGNAGDMLKADYLMRAAGNALFSQGVLSSMGDLVSMAQGDTSLSKLPSKFTGGFIPGQGLMRDIARLLDPTQISSDTMLAAMLRDVPVVRNLAGRPALNVFGEPVKFEGLQRLPVVSRVMTSQKPNHISDWLGSQKLSIPALPQYIEVGKYLSQQEKAAMGMFERRERVAGEMSRMEAGMLTPEEAYRFAQIAGENTKTGLLALKKRVDEMQAKGQMVPVEKIQSQVDTVTLAARRMAMLELVDRVR